MRYFDAIVVGGGLAGLRAAIELNRRNVPVAVISKIHPVRSHSGAAQGGVNAALGNHYRGVYDTPRKHAFDTIKGSDYLADQDAVVRMCEEGPERIYELERWGCPFSRNEDGRIAQRPFGGAGFPRCAYATDKTGHVMLQTLYEQAVRYEQLAERSELTFLDEWLVLALAYDGEACRGVVAMKSTTGEIEGFHSDAVIFATGGSGRIYAASSNALTNSGLGMAVPYRAGVPLKDMEFVQFHPTTLVGTNILLTEGARGEGGYLLNAQGDRFLGHYDDSKRAMEVAPRDIISRNIQREVLAGRGFGGGYVHIDLRHLGEERIVSRLPGIRDLCRSFLGLDPVTAPIPVQPAQHYTMGGIDTDASGRTRMKGLYAAGECACVSVHGANRLGGNSLLETVVFGAIAGSSAADDIEGSKATRKGAQAVEAAAAEQKARLDKLRAADGPESWADLKETLGRTMTEKVGIFRNAADLREALDAVRDIRSRFGGIRVGCRSAGFNPELAAVLELEGSIEVAEAVVAGALAREESRGSQSRTDFPKRDDEKWLRHTLATWTPDGPTLDYAPVKLGHFEPAERKY